jgi:hypothetical protein
MDPSQSKTFLHYYGYQDRTDQDSDPPYPMLGCCESLAKKIPLGVHSAVEHNVFGLNFNTFDPTGCRRHEVERPTTKTLSWAREVSQTRSSCIWVADACGNRSEYSMFPLIRVRGWVLTCLLPRLQSLVRCETWPGKSKPTLEETRSGL